MAWTKRPKRAWRVFAVFAFVAASSAAQVENLLANPGFEMLTPDGTPEDWDMFVMPMEGAMGRVSSDAFSGERSVSLFTPVPYSVDPANNWSQVVYGEFGGKTLQASAQVRSEDVGGAALWIQCFQRTPVRVLAAGSSSVEYAFSGTNDWTEITATVDAPEGTRYVVVRCVIQGVGRVWFDAVRLSVSDLGSGFEAGVEPPAEPAASIGEEMASVQEQMLSALAEIQESNQGLRTELGALQSDLGSLRAELQERAEPESDVPLSPTAAEEMERTRQDIAVTLEDQAEANEALQAEINEIETQLEQLRARAPEQPAVTVTGQSEAPVEQDIAEDFERLRNEVEASLAERDGPDGELRDAISDIRKQLRSVHDQLVNLASVERGAEAEPVEVSLPPGMLDELSAAREQMQEVIRAQDASDDALREEVAGLSAQLSDIRMELDTLVDEGPGGAEVEPGAFVEQFDTLREQFQSTLDEVRQANKELRGRIGELQSELQQLRGDLADVESAAEEVDPSPEEEPTVRHILVPRVRGSEE